MIEPYLSDQWFVKMDELAKPAIEAVQDRQAPLPSRLLVQDLPALDGEHPRLVHLAPALVGTPHSGLVRRGRHHVCLDRSPHRRGCVPGYDPATLVQDEDVLDTWFSSWLWPFSTFGWPEKTPELQKFYPTKVLVTASEIIFLWVARMVMAGYEFMGECPFTDVYIHGTVRDANGIKMSKSLGNGIDPLEIIEKYGADALRISLVLATPDGQDPWISRNTFEGGRNFVNKLYQVSRFVMMRLDGRPPVLETVDRQRPGDFRPLDSLATRKDNRVGRQGRSPSTACRAAAKTLYNFVWDDYCSWYVELIKPDQPGEPIRESSLNVATYVLHQILRLLHPFVPFVTEEILRAVGRR